MLEAATDAFSTAVFRASNAAFGPWTVALLLGTGLFLTVRLRFVQVRHFREALASLRRAKGTGEGALSPFQAFATALAASVGTGNIAGVATAIVSGGPGALFWIWCYGFFATAINCIAFPFGTILGVFTLVVLNRDSVRAMFES